MKTAKNEIYQLISTDADILNMLAANKPWNRPKGTSSKVNSIIPAGKATATTKGPFITIQGGPRSKVDPLGHVYDEFFYIRCYNDGRKSYIQIDEVLERVEDLLDGANLPLADGGNVLTTLEDTLPEREDEAINLNYIEARYRVRIVQ